MWHFAVARSLPHTRTEQLTQWIYTNHGDVFSEGASEFAAAFDSCLGEHLENVYTR
jgi:hypothetical protein